MKNSVILTGFIGAGQNTIGQWLAFRLGYAFMDFENLIEQRQGRTIQEIVAKEGEAFFRQLESEFCAEISTLRGYVVSTGEATLTNPENLERLSQDNLVIYLYCDPHALWERIYQTDARPLVKNPIIENKKEQFFRLFHEREPAYAHIPIRIDMTNRQTDEIVGDLVHLWRKMQYDD